MPDDLAEASRAFWHRHTTIVHAPAVFKTEQECAETIADIDDDEWSYKPSCREDGGWVVKVYDEDGTFMGVL